MGILFIEKLVDTLFEFIMNRVSYVLSHEIFLFFSWVENSIASERMVDILPDVKKIVQFLDEVAWIKTLKFKSYINFQT